jgi:predicted nucleic acid-binding Zn ribbon protein
MTGVHMLPMVVCGLTANLVAALIQHKVSNKLIVGIGAGAYLISFILAAVQRYGDSYWAFTFPAFCIVVVGADFQFIVANVGPKAAIIRTPTDYCRCMCSHRCQQISNPSQARSYRLSLVCVLQLGLVLLRPSSTRYRIILRVLDIMPTMPSSLSQPSFGSL